ncbi:MAG TPA: hypothetical protein VFB43_12205 [Terracidiphilus sp.]|nr:hypothetical protein [Terracidiphilus sp.]
MYNPNLLPPETLSWVFSNAQNELHAYLCEIDYHAMHGKEWPKMAYRVALRCRSIAVVAAHKEDRDAWFELAKLYEDSIT